MRKGALHGPLDPLRSAQDRLPSHPSAGPTGPLGKKAGAEFSGRPSPPAPRAFQQPLARPLPREVTGRSWPEAALARPLGLCDWALLPADPEALRQQGGCSGPFAFEWPSPPAC